MHCVKQIYSNNFVDFNSTRQAGDGVAFKSRTFSGNAILKFDNQNDQLMLCWNTNLSVCEIRPHFDLDMCDSFFRLITRFG